MSIQVRLFPTIRELLPADFPNPENFTVTLSDLELSQVTINDLIGYLRLPPPQIDLAIVNGSIVRNFASILNDGDTIVLSPAIGGG